MDGSLESRRIKRAPLPLRTSLNRSQTDLFHERPRCLYFSPEIIPQNAMFRRIWVKDPVAYRVLLVASSPRSEEEDRGISGFKI